MGHKKGNISEGFLKFIGSAHPIVAAVVLTRENQVHKRLTGVEK